MLRYAVVIFTVVLASAVPASAQSSDDFFNPDVLQRIDLWLNSDDWAKLKANFQENTYYPAQLSWNGITVENVGIRSRGLGSRRGTKPGLRVDMDRYSTGQQFLGLKSFVLDNLSQDPSGIRETVAMRFFTRLGIPAPRETFCRLYVRGVYVGLYGLVESVDKTMMGRVFGEINGNIQNDGYLFEHVVVFEQVAVVLHVVADGAVEAAHHRLVNRFDQAIEAGVAPVDVETRVCFARRQDADAREEPHRDRFPDAGHVLREIVEHERLQPEKLLAAVIAIEVETQARLGARLARRPPPEPASATPW